MPRATYGFPTNPDLLEHYGPTIAVQIGYHDRDGALQLSSDVYDALVDTGADASCIDSTLAAELNLKIVDKQYAAGVLGSGLVNVYSAQLYIPDLSAGFVGGFPGLPLADDELPHAVIIGREFLRHYTLLYEGRTGVFTISND